MNKVINLHKQFNRSQSFVQHSTHDAAKPDSSYIFQNKGKKGRQDYKKIQWKF